LGSYVNKVPQNNNWQKFSYNWNLLKKNCYKFSKLFIKKSSRNFWTTPIKNLNLSAKFHLNHPNTVNLWKKKIHAQLRRTQFWHHLSSFNLAKLPWNANKFSRPAINWLESPHIVNYNKFSLSIYLDVAWPVGDSFRYDKNKITTLSF
jgi:hypothetical protein